MAQIRAALRFTALLFATFGLYGIWFLFRWVIPNRIYWRQWAFERWAHAFLRIANVRLEVIGEAPKPPFFLVCNHVSYMDIPVVRAAAKGVFIAKHEIESWPFMGKIVRDMGTIYVNRTVKRDIPRAGERVIERLSAGEGVIVFPEGTSSKGENVLPFNSSFLAFAARSDIPVSYVALTYRTHDGSPPPSETVCWWDDTPFLKHIFRLFSTPGFDAILNFGDEPIIDPDRKRLAANLQESVRNKFIPML